MNDKPAPPQTVLAVAEVKPFWLGLGIDRIGLVAVRAPLVSLFIIILLTAAATVGFLRLKVDDSLSELFRTSTKEYRAYEQIERLFPSAEYDVLVVVEGRRLLSRDGIEALREVAKDLQLIDGVTGLVSMLSARRKPDPSGYAAPLVPDELPQGAAYDAIVRDLRENEIVAGKFLSPDGQLALMVLSLDRGIVAIRGADKILAEIKGTVAGAVRPIELSVQLTGAPVMQLEIRQAVERDRLIYNGLGFLLGAGLAYLYFGRLSLTLIAVAGPAVAILWTLGVLGWLDWRLNLFVNVLAPLILVSGFSDSMHLVFSIRRSILAGEARHVAARRAVAEVAPACLLTAMNAALALVSFSWAESALIRTFGLASLMAVAISYLAVAVVVPTLAAVFIGRGRGRRTATAESRPEREEEEHGALARATIGLITFAGRWSLPLWALGVVAVVASGIGYGRLQPMYRLADQVPDKEQAIKATGRLDEKLTGANPVHIMITWSGPETLYDGKTLAVIAASHQALEAKAGLGNVWSLESLRRWLAEAGETSIDVLKGYVRVLPVHLVRRFISMDERAVLVTGRLPDIDASQLVPVVDKIDAALEPVRQAYPDYQISVTGLPVIAARNSATLISELNWGLVGDIFVIFIFIGIALRSVMVGIASVMPSLFPIFATGATLYVLGEGLQFASIIAITVAFSLAIDSTIHFLNRYRLEETRADGVDTGVRATMRRAAGQIGPVVVVTTLVLAAGLGVTMFSDLPSLRLFGRLAVVCLGSSLLSQLVILPATIATYRWLFPYRRARSA